MGPLGHADEQTPKSVAVLGSCILSKPNHSDVAGPNVFPRWRCPKGSKIGISKFQTMMNKIEHIDNGYRYMHVKLETYTWPLLMCTKIVEFLGCLL
jgi:hypothetical protein